MSEVDVEELLDSADSNDEVDLQPELDEESHAKLVDRVKALYGSRDAWQRVEASQSVSEFDFLRQSGPALSAFDMLKDLNNTKELRKNRNKILKIKRKAGSLPVPLPKVQQDRLQRVLGYTKVSDNLKKWDTVVEHHKRADQIQFPLNDEPIKLESSVEFAKRFEASTKLEEEVEKLLSTSKHRLNVDCSLTRFEEEKLRQLSKEEAIIRLRELRRLRVLMHTEALRNRRIRKIKSRQFHRIQRKDKLKAAIRDFELLKAIDPEKALEKLEELEQVRREARAGLRHKGKSSWASRLAQKGKFDKKAQQALRERIELGRELERKVSMGNEKSDNSEDEHDERCKIENNLLKKSGQGCTDESVVLAKNELRLGGFSIEDSDNDISEKLSTGVRSSNPWLQSAFFEPVSIPIESEQVSKVFDQVPETVSSDNVNLTKRSRRTKKRKSSSKVASLTNTAVCENKTNTINLKRKRSKSSKSRTYDADKSVSKQVCANVEGMSEDRSVALKNEEQVALQDSGVCVLGDENSGCLTPKETDKAINYDGDVTAILSRSSLLLEEDSRSIEKTVPTTLDYASAKTAVFIDPEKVIDIGSNGKELKSHLSLATDDGSSSDDEEMGGVNTLANSERQRKLVQEAFAGDDVVEDFVREQREKDASERDAERKAALMQKGLEGDWVTPNNIHKLDSKKEKFLEARRKAFVPKAAVVYRDQDSKALQPHRVADLPKGFTSVAQFEAVLKQPIGSTFNTQGAFTVLTRPRVVTQRGKIIPPINQEALLKVDSTTPRAPIRSATDCKHRASTQKQNV